MSAKEGCGPNRAQQGDRVLDLSGVEAMVVRELGDRLSAATFMRFLGAPSFRYGGNPALRRAPLWRGLFERESHVGDQTGVEVENEAHAIRAGAPCRRD